MLFDEISNGSDDSPEGASFTRPDVPTEEDRAQWLRGAIMPHESWLRTVLRRKHPGIDMDEVLQATYLRLMAAEDVAHIKDAKYYLYRTAMSEIVQRARRSQIVEFKSVDFDTVEWAADEPTIESVVDSKRALNHFYDALKALPPRQRAVVELRRIERLCVRATADRLATSVSSVEKLQKHAMRRLSAAMAHL